MRYAEVRYETTRGPSYLELYHFNGTYRGVMFKDERSAMMALRPGRAELDCSAIDDGLLPKGANLVSRAGVPDDLTELLAGIRSELGQVTLLDETRLRFSLWMLAGRSAYVTEDRDAVARARDPERAARYDRGVAIISGE